MKEITNWIRQSRFKKNSKTKTWKIYKRFFLRKKKSHFIVRFKYFFNTIRVFKKQYTHTHVLKSTNLIAKYRNKCLKISTNKVYNFFNLLNFRLHLVLVHCHFVFNKIKSLIILKKGYVSVNNKIIKHQNYILSVNDLIYFFNKIKIFSLLIKKIFFRQLRQRRIRRSHIFRFKYLRRCILINFFEINYRIRSLIYLRPLQNTELVKKKRRWKNNGQKGSLKVFNIFNLKLIKLFWSLS